MERTKGISDMSARETVKILLFKRGMTMKTLAEKLSELTGKKYSRQNLSGRLANGYLRYNEMEQIAKILEYKIDFQDLTE
ncbi:hypothetical protein IJ843_03630 [bacterium]|nr:hypothetical protein [bacterium]